MKLPTKLYEGLRAAYPIISALALSLVAIKDQLDWSDPTAVIISALLILSTVSGVIFNGAYHANKSNSTTVTISEDDLVDLKGDESAEQ